MFKKILLTLLLTIQCDQPCFSMEQAPDSSNFFATLYGYLLGNENINPEYTQLIHVALQQLGVANPSAVTIKQMNAVGPALALQDLASFTAFGIWLNQEYLETLDRDTLTFLMYHEASHYVQQHHQKTIVACIISLLILIAEICLLKNWTYSIHPAIQVPTLITSALLSILAWYRFFLPILIKRQEKQADLMAAKTLIDNGAIQVVEAVITKLKNAKNTDESSIWWYSNNDVVRYLEELRNILYTKKN